MYFAPELEGVRGKLFRAVDHFRDIDVAVSELFALNNKSAGSKLSDDGDIIVTYPHQPPLDPRFAPIIGDCLHNVRSSLDHLVAQLAILNRAPANAIERTMFPVCLKPQMFKELSSGKVAPFVSSKALAEIERLQPYSTGDGDKDILWVLSQLDILDKHRLLIVAKHKVRVTSFTATLGEAQPLFIDIPNGPWKSAENGAEIIRFRLDPKPPSPIKMHVEMSAEGSIQIEQTGLDCDGKNLHLILRDCIEYVGQIVDHFGVTFFRE